MVILAKETVDEIRVFLSRYSQRELQDIVAPGCGVSWHTLQKIRTGSSIDPLTSTVLKIKEYMERT